MSTDSSWTPEQLFLSVPEGGWRTRLEEEVVQAIHQDPQKVLGFLLFALHNMLEGDTTKSAVSYVHEADLPALATAAVEVLQTNPKHKLAQSIIASISLQRPTALHPHLQTLYELRPNARTTTVAYPWRESGDLHLNFLAAERWKEGQDREDLRFAQDCLLEARSSKTLHAAVTPLAESLSAPNLITGWLGEVGFILREGTPQPLYREQGWHLIFTEPGYMPRWHYQDHHHPTWSLPTEGAEHLFGGQLENGICGKCGQPLHRLISLDPVPKGLQVSLEQLTFASCLSCMGWDGDFLYYQHDPQGRPTSVEVQDDFTEPEIPAEALPVSKVRLARTPPRWRWQDWGNANSRQNLHRLGGYPSWIQSPEYPGCPQCGEVMTFILQLDSDLPTTEGESWGWGSGGIAYAWWCDGCRVSAFHWQCT